MSKQLHKNFTDDQVKLLLEKYSKKEIKLNYILQMLRIKRRRFFKLLEKYRKDLDSFSIQYERKTINRKIDLDIERNIIKELKIEKDLIKNKDKPIKWSEPLRLDTLSLNTPCIPESYSLPITQRGMQPLPIIYIFYKIRNPFYYIRKGFIF